MQTILMVCLLSTLGVLGYPDMNQDTSLLHEERDEEHRKTVEDLQRRSVQCARQKQKLGAEVKRLTTLVKELNKTAEIRQGMVDGFITSNSHFTKENKMLTQELGELEAETKSLKNHLKELDQGIVQLTKDKKNCTEDFEKCRDSKFECYKLQREALHNMTICATDKEALYSDVQSKKSAIQMQEKVIAECTQHNKEADLKIEECANEKEAQDKALQEKNDIIKENEKAVGACAEQKEKYLKNKEDLERIAEELEKDLARAQAEAMDIRSKIKEVQQQQMQHRLKGRRHRKHNYYMMLGDS